MAHDREFQRKRKDTRMPVRDSHGEDQPAARQTEQDFDLRRARDTPSSVNGKTHRQDIPVQTEFSQLSPETPVSLLEQGDAYAAALDVFSDRFEIPDATGTESPTQDNGRSNFRQEVSRRSFVTEDVTDHDTGQYAPSSEGSAPPSGTDRSGQGHRYRTHQHGNKYQQRFQEAAQAEEQAAQNLLAGGYFIKESKAPEGYQPDPNAYYFSITEDGQVAVVENGEAGHGFTNEAYRGNLKITKDSSDGRKDGFAIEVKSADGSYCETFTTPKSGVIEVKGLRVGIYTVTEVANRASKDYIIPDAATVEIKADQTSTVQFFNEKPEKPGKPEKPSVPSNPSTPQKPVPQTGDDPYIFLYGGLLAAALIGGSVFAVYYFKKGKYSRTSPKRTAVGISVLSLCVLVAFGSGFLVFRDLNQYAESKDAYQDLAGYVEVPEQTASPEQATDPTETKQDDADIVLPSVDFEALRENGPDIIGWLSLPDTVLNYPVTQTDNNEYYLNHLYDGTYNKVGCLFADYENQAGFSDRNTIVYGHNMRDGSMFALLNRYDEQSYFDTHRQMYLVTPKGGYVMEILAAFAAKPEESGSETSPWQLSWKDDGAYTTWLTAMKERSAVESDVTVTCSDKVLTLSTCTPGGTGRFLVMGKLVKVDNEI